MVGTARPVAVISSSGSVRAMVGGGAVAAIAMVSIGSVRAVPRRIPVVGAAVVHHRRSVPATVPTAPSPTAASASHHGADGDPGTKPDDARRGHIPCCISGRYIRGPVDHGRVVLRDVNNLRIGWLNDDRLRRLLHHGNLLAGFETAFFLGLCAQGLNGRHHVGLLVVIGLSERRSP